MGQVVTRGRRHRVLVRDDRGVVVGVAEALDLVQRIDVAGRPIERREVHVDEHLALGLLRSSILRKICENFSVFFLRMVRVVPGRLLRGLQGARRRGLGLPIRRRWLLRNKTAGAPAPKLSRDALA